MVVIYKSPSLSLFIRSPSLHRFPFTVHLLLHFSYELIFDPKKIKVTFPYAIGNNCLGNKNYFDSL